MGLIKHNKKKDLEVGIIIGVIALGFAFIALSQAVSVSNKVVQNNCDGILRIYGRCEQSLNGNTIIIPALGTINFQVNYTVPFKNTPYVTIQLLSNPFSAVGQSNDVMLSNNGTRISGTCIDCTTFVFPTANTFGVLPSSSGYLSIKGGFDFPSNNYPSIPTLATLNINVVSLSNNTSNGRNIWIQGFDTDSHGDGSCIGAWETLGNLSERPGLTNNGQIPIFNWGIGFFHGDRGTFGGVTDINVPTAINQSIISDNANAYPFCNTSGDTALRVVGQLTSGHETITYSQLYVTFYYPITSGSITILALSITSFTVMVIGPPGLSVTFNWKAISENG